MSRAGRRAERRRASTAGLEQGDRLEQGRAESRATQGVNAELEQGDGEWAGRQHSRVAAQQGRRRRKIRKNDVDGVAAGQNEDGAVEIGGATQGNGDGTAEQRHTRGDDVAGYGRKKKPDARGGRRRKSDAGDRKALAADGGGVAG